MTIQAPEAPATPPAEPAAAPAPPPAAPPAPAAAPPAPQPATPRVPPGQPEGGQFAAAPAAPAPVPAPPPAAPETDWKAQAEAATAEAARHKADAERWKQQSRTQEQRSKANHAQAKGLEGVVRQIAEKLEIPFEDQPDPAEVSRKLTAAQAETRQLRVERAIYLTAAKSGANANALLDSREFIARTEQIDPEASDFADQVADLVRAVASEARYQVPQPPAPPAPQAAAPAAAPPAQQPPAQPPAPSSGADFSGAPGGNRTWTQADYDYWTQPGRDRDGSVMAKAIEDGLLVNLGIGKPRRSSSRR